jgi:anti-sigma factor ChrR (cupin superfamily)
MSSPQVASRCAELEQVSLHAVGALPASEVPALEAHVSLCAECRRELEALRRVVDSFAHWPINVLRPSGSLWERLAGRIAVESGAPAAGGLDPSAEHDSSDAAPLADSQWEEVAPGIRCRLLATDSERDRVSMLVQLAPGVHYPPHRHGGVEELHLLDGELWIGECKLLPGDYNRAEPGTIDTLVWSETGCTCVLITSPSDVLS